MENINNFLKELEQLTNKYGLYIGGCGCCNSPYICKIGENVHIADNLYYDEDTCKFEVEGYWLMLNGSNFVRTFLTTKK